MRKPLVLLCILSAWTPELRAALSAVDAPAQAPANPVFAVSIFSPQPVRADILRAVQTVASYTSLPASGLRNPWSDLAPLVDQVAAQIAASQAVAEESWALLRPWTLPLEQALEQNQNLLDEMTDIERHPRQTLDALEPLRRQGAGEAAKAERELLSPFYSDGSRVVVLAPNAPRKFASIFSFLSQLRDTGLYRNQGSDSPIRDKAKKTMMLAQSIRRRMPEPGPEEPEEDKGSGEQSTPARTHAAANHSPKDGGLLPARTEADVPLGNEVAGQPGVYELDGIVYTSAVMRKVLERALKAAASDATILITGESGTGKELFAYLIHNHSPRRGKPMLPVNAAGITEGVADSELFGHEKGSFTGADRKRAGRFRTADGGTLFVDEIGDASPAIQSKLLRAIEKGEVQAVGEDKPGNVSVRLIAATNKDLAHEASFRKDLYYRLNTVKIHLPPLRDRVEDILPLARYYLASFAKNPKAHFSPEAEQALLAYSWPGNVRELKHAIENTVIFAHDNEINPEDLPAEITAAPAAPAATAAAPLLAAPQVRMISLHDVEARHIWDVLEATGWNKSQASKTLEVERSTIDRKIETYGLKPGVPPQPQPRTDHQ